jgi:hypothetical protein
MVERRGSVHGADPYQLPVRAPPIHRRHRASASPAARNARCESDVEWANLKEDVAVRYVNAYDLRICA